MSELNVPNRTLAIVDNLQFLRSLNNECIDLIAIDPPFAANDTFTGRPRPPISDEELAEEIALANLHGAAHNEGIGETTVKDVWKWDEDVHPSWKAAIEDDYPQVFKVIEAVEACATENEAAYICYMGVRLLECHRVLKSTGTIYIHCNERANSYLRMLLDAIFGRPNFLNEVVWHYEGPQRPSRKNFGRKHDTIWRYGKTSSFFANEEGIFPPRLLGQKELSELKQDKDGKYFYDTPRGDYTDESIARLDTEGRILWTRFGKPRVKFYMEMDEEGNYYRSKQLHDVWSDVTSLGHAGGAERTGYATQKPLALYERIISASSRRNDVVLDIFAGCATTAVAAERLGRRWIACDWAYRSWTMLKRRFYLNGYALSDMTDATRRALGEHQTALQEAESSTIGPTDLPARYDSDPAPRYGLEQPRRNRRPSLQSSGWSGRIPKEEAKRLLIERFGPVCWGCGFEPRRPNGTLDLTLLEVDHIRARNAAEGVRGDDELYNLALLHSTCNRIKRNRLTLEQLRQHNAHERLLYVDRTGDLVDLFEATRFAAEQIAVQVVQRGG